MFRLKPLICGLQCMDLEKTNYHLSDRLYSNVTHMKNKTYRIFEIETSQEFVFAQHCFN